MNGIASDYENRYNGDAENHIDNINKDDVRSSSSSHEF